jgi:hypothetical protein
MSRTKPVLAVFLIRGDALSTTVSPIDYGNGTPKHKHMHTRRGISAPDPLILPDINSGMRADIS